MTPELEREMVHRIMVNMAAARNQTLATWKDVYEPGKSLVITVEIAPVEMPEEPE